MLRQRYVARTIADSVSSIFQVRSTELSRFLRDAKAFVASSREAIKRSAPHIYLSALPFAAKNSFIYTTFSSLITGVVSVQTLGIDHHGQRLAMSLTGHKATVNSVAYTLDGRLVSVSWDGTVRVWDTRTGDESMSLSCGGNEAFLGGGSELGILSGGNERFLCVAVAPSETRLAAGTYTGALYIWSMEALLHHPLRLSGHSERIYSIAFSPDGCLIASASMDHSVRLWTVETGQQSVVLSGHNSDVRTVAFSPNGEILASGSADKTLRLWTNITGKSTQTHILDQDAEVHSVCFSPDSARLAVGLGDGNIRLSDVMTRTHTKTLRGHTGFVSSVQFSPDGRSLLSSSWGDSVRLWNLHQNAAEISSVHLRGHSHDSHFVSSAVFSPDGLYIAAGSVDPTIQVWDASTDQQAALPLEAHQGAVISVAASANGAFITSRADDGTVRVWDSQTGKAKLPPNKYAISAWRVSPDARFAVSMPMDGTVRLCDLRTGDGIGEPLRLHKDKVCAMEFSPDARWVACGFNDGTMYIWDVTTQQPLNIGPFSCQQEAASRATPSDESVLNVAGQPQSIVKSRRPRVSIDSIAFSPDGRLVAGGDSEGKIHLWNMNTGQQAREHLQATEYDRYVFQIAFSSSGLHIASRGEGDVGRIWDITKGEPIFSLVGHTNRISCIAYLPGGKFIATSSADLSVRLWDADNGGPVAVLRGHTSYMRSIACMSSNQSIVTGSDDSTIRVWDVKTALEQSQTGAANPMAVFEQDGLHDGWVLGRGGELLLWVPKEYHDYLVGHSCKLLIAKHRVTVTTGDVWHHGDDWTACWLGASST